MRRYARTLALVVALVLLAGIILGIQTIEIGDFERGGDTLLGLSLGLDLQGGVHLVYRAVDTETAEPIVPAQDKMEALKKSIERRVNASGLGEPIIQLLGDDRLLIQLPGVGDPDRAKSLIGETAQLVFKHRKTNVPIRLDEISSDDIVSVTIGALRLPEEEASAEAESTPISPLEAIVAVASPESEEVQGEAGTEGESPEEALEIPMLIVEFTEAGAERFAQVVDRLRESLGLDENLQPVDDTENIFPNSISISVEGKESRTFRLTFGPQLGVLALAVGGDPRELAGPPYIQRIDAGNSFALSLAGIAPDVAETRAIFGDEPQVLFNEEIIGSQDNDIGLTGDDLARAYPGQHSASGAPIINIEFNQRGTRIFGELTGLIAGTSDQIAIFLDQEELIAPVVTTPITSGVAFIQGGQGRPFTIEEVRDTSLLLESGSLPVSIELIQERDVDAILGADSLAKSVAAGAVGLALVLLFMALYYRVPGVVAAIALLIYGTLVLAIFKILPVTLTLSGIAAVILSVGMAVDANILIFERMKDELRAGRTLLSAINNGFNRAWPAIRDSNVSTLITCGILFYFASRLGTTVVQGFAVALAIGVGVSMFSAITVSRTLLRVMATTALARRLNLFVPTGGAELPQQQVAATATPRS